MWPSLIFTRFTLYVTEVKTNTGMQLVLSYHAPEQSYEHLIFYILHCDGEKFHHCFCFHKIHIVRSGTLKCVNLCVSTLYIIECILLGITGSDLSTGMWSDKTKCTPGFVLRTLNFFCFPPKKTPTTDNCLTVCFKILVKNLPFIKLTLCIKEVSTNTGAHLVLSYHAPKLRYNSTYV